jgi:peptide/nickel transport system permease protein
MLKDSQLYLSSAPWYALGTGAAIVLLLLAVSLLGEGLSHELT